VSLTKKAAQIVAESTSPLLDSPEDWPRQPLGEVATLINGFAFSSKLFSPDAEMPLVRIRDLFSTTTAVGYSGDYDPRYIVEPDDLLVGMDGDFNAARWRGPRALLNQRVCKIVPNPELLDLDYLTFVLPGYLQAIHDVTSSTTVSHLSSRDIAEIPIPVPPLAMQRRVATTLRHVAAKRASAEQRIQYATATVDQLRRALLAAACLGRLTADCRTDTKDSIQHETPRSAQPLLDTPASWSWSTLGEIADIRGGIQVGAKRRGGEPMRQVPYLRVANVQRGWLDLAEIKTILATESQIEALRLEPGDIFFNEGGDRDKLGRGWVWEGQIPECIHQNHVFRARLRDPQMQPRFYSWYGNTFGMLYFFAEGKQTVNLASLSKTKLSQLPVPVPSVEEQALIVARVEALLASADRLIENIGLAQTRVDRTGGAILAKAFRGDLVVN
jgi:type I restriction enzyme, S subunit